ncbi:MAG: methionyl-tRNA formyltransferase, partial [Victivallales bacterium]|nr:methionyl-tRNA formyltransferase [Victivallales bacterium]
MSERSEDCLPRVYFLGSGVLAVAPLERLCGSSSVELVGIATQPDKPAGRRHGLRPTPAGRWLADNNLHADKPASVNSPEFLAHLKSLAPGIVLVASFGQILGKEMLGLPAVACVNLHASLLPAYRGAAPIAAAIADGAEKTGLSFMKMDAGLDTGPVYRSFELPVSGMNAVELELRLARLGAAKVEQMIEDIFHGRVVPEAQDHSMASYAGKISKEDGMLDWREPAEVIERKIRAYQPWP